MLSDAAVELAGKAFDDAPMARAVANVRPTQAASRQASDALRRRNEQHRLSFQLGRICRHNPRRRTTIDADVINCPLIGSCLFRHRLDARCQQHHRRRKQKCKWITFHNLSCCISLIMGIQYKQPNWIYSANKNITYNDSLNDSLNDTI